MVVDFHTHVFPDKIAARTIEKLENKGGSKAFTNGTELGLVNSMKNAGISCAVALPVVTRPEQFRTVNEFAVGLNEKYNDNSETRIISFGGIHPDSSDYRSELREIVHMGLMGIKLHPDYQNTMIDDIRYMRLIDYASELDLIVSVHAGQDVGYPDPVHCMPKAARRLIDEVAPKKLVLAHMGGYNFWNDVEKYLVGQPVYFDTAYVHNTILPEQFVRMIEHHGSDKILYATDSPWSGHKESLRWIRNLNLPLETSEKILHKNAEELLQMVLQR